MSAPEARCPVCRARFRAARTCRRCGGDLGPVMAVMASAYLLRRRARAAALAVDLRRAQALARRAQALHDTEPGRRLLRLANALLRLQIRAHDNPTQPPGRPPPER